MKRLLKIFGFLLGFLVLAIACMAAWVNYGDLPTHPVRNLAITLPTDSLSLAKGQGLVETVCSHCHRGSDGKLSGKLFSPESAGFGEIWSANITNHPTLGLGRYADGELAWLLRTGIKRDGKLTGPFMLFPNLSDEDLAAVIAYLRTDAPCLQASDAAPRTSYSFLLKALIKTGAFKPLPYDEKPRPTPPASDTLAYGKYLATARWDCSGCHSASFETYNVVEPEMSPGYLGGGNPIDDPNFKKVISRNITPHPEKGIGKWTFEQFKLAIMYGQRPDGAVLDGVMPRFAVLDEQEIRAIWAYLQTVPALANPAQPPAQ